MRLKASQSAKDFLIELPERDTRLPQTRRRRPIGRRLDLLACSGHWTHAGGFSLDPGRLRPWGAQRAAPIAREELECPGGSAHDGHVAVEFPPPDRPLGFGRVPFHQAE